MITLSEYIAALRVIASYQEQVGNESVAEVAGNSVQINIQNDITLKMFRVLQMYYEQNYDIDLEWNDLVAMDVCLLASIDFGKMKDIRGLGSVSVYQFKKLFVYVGIIEAQLLNRRNFK